MLSRHGDLRTRIEDATGCGELDGFTCGDGHLRAERVIDEIFAAAHAGSWPRSTLRVTRDMRSGALVGACLIAPGPIPVKHPRLTAHAYRNAPYIAGIGLFKEHRGRTRGDHLLRDALEHIKRTTRGGMPRVLALIAPDNEPALKLFQRHGFEQSSR